MDGTRLQWSLQFLENSFFIQQLGMEIFRRFVYTPLQGRCRCLELEQRNLDAIMIAYVKSPAMFQLVLGTDMAEMR